MIFFLCGVSSGSIVRVVNEYYSTHLVSSVDRSLCYVNKEYNLGILKGIILLFMSIKFLVHTRNKINVCALVCVSAVLTTNLVTRQTSCATPQIYGVMRLETSLHSILEITMTVARLTDLSVILSYFTLYILIILLTPKLNHFLSIYTVHLKQSFAHYSISLTSDTPSSIAYDPHSFLMNVPHLSPLSGRPIGILLPLSCFHKNLHDWRHHHLCGPSR